MTSSFVAPPLRPRWPRRRSPPTDRPCAHTGRLGAGTASWPASLRRRWPRTPGSRHTHLMIDRVNDLLRINDS